MTQIDANGAVMVTTSSGGEAKGLHGKRLHGAKKGRTNINLNLNLNLNTTPFKVAGRGVSRLLAKVFCRCDDQHRVQMLLADRMNS